MKQEIIVESHVKKKKFINSVKNQTLTPKR